MYEVEKSIEIWASPEKCFKTICDFETYPEWQQAIKKVTILDQDEKNGPTVVEYELDVFVKTINYTLNYKYEENNSKKFVLKWDYAGGDLKNIEGSYTFEEAEKGKTLATYSLTLELAAKVPEFILKKLKDKMMTDSMNSLKKRSEDNI